MRFGEWLLGGLLTRSLGLGRGAGDWKLGSNAMGTEPKVEQGSRAMSGNSASSRMPWIGARATSCSSASRVKQHLRAMSGAHRDIVGVLLFRGRLRVVGGPGWRFGDVKGRTDTIVKGWMYGKHV